MLCQPAEASKIARVFVKNNQQNMLDDSSLDCTKRVNNGNSSKYDQNARTSGDINVSDLFKALKEDHKQVIVEQKHQWNLPLPLETLTHREMIHLCIFKIQRMTSWSIFCSLLKWKKHLKKLLR